MLYSCNIIFMMIFMINFVKHLKPYDNNDKYHDNDDNKYITTTTTTAILLLQLLVLVLHDYHTIIENDITDKLC